MNLDRLEIGLKCRMDRIREAYSKGLMTPEQIFAEGRRAGTLKRKIITHRETFGHDVRIVKFLKAARCNRSSIVAFDVEFNEDVFYEVGVSTVLSDDHTTMSLIVKGHENRICRKRHYGRYERMSADDVLAKVREAYDASGMVILHHGINDRAILKLPQPMVGKFFLDTSYLAASIGRIGNPSLEGLCRFFGIDDSDSHEGGNDAHRTLLIAQRFMDEVVDIHSLWRMRGQLREVF